MADYKRFDTSSNSDFTGVRVTKVNRRSQGENEFVELSFFRSSAKDRYKDLRITASYRADDKRFKYILDRIQKGDRVTVKGPVHYRAYVPKTVDVKKLKSHDDLLEAVRQEGEIPFPTDLVCHEDLRNRDAGGEMEDESLGGGKVPEADVEPESGGENFFGDE